MWQNGGMRLFASHAAGSAPLPHMGTSVVALVLFMRYTLAGDDWLASTMRAGASSASSAVWLPTSTTVPILSPVAAVPSAASAAPRLSSAATVTLITPVYGEPPLVTFVFGANVTAALSVATVTFRGGNVPVWRLIAAASVPLTVVSVLLGPITVTVVPVPSVPVPPVPVPSVPVPPVPVPSVPCPAPMH